MLNDGRGLGSLSLVASAVFFKENGAVHFRRFRLRDACRRRQARDVKGFMAGS